jgi:glutamyl-tRNA synthetase
VWRLAIHHPEGQVVVPDMLRCDVAFARRDLDDPVVVRSDGSFTFLLPNAIDDAVDGITHVLRGDDHLTNSAYQVWLLQQLGYAVPVYLHHGLLLGQDGSKLSKRSGSHSVESLREAGLLPGALIQAMARLGHPNISEDLLTLEDLAEAFVPRSISTGSVKWSDEDMWHWHTRLLHQMDADDLATMMAPLFPSLERACLKAFAALIQDNIDRVEQARDFARLIDPDHPLSELSATVVRQAGQDFFRVALQCWSEQEDDVWKNWADEVRKRSGYKGKNLFMPLRAALTGQTHGPEMSAVLRFLGHQGVQERLEHCLGQFGGERV